MLSLNDKISIRQLQALLVLNIFGTGVTTLPRMVSSFSQQDGWIGVVVATILIMLSTFIIATLAEMFSNDSFYSYSSRILTRPLGFVVSVLFVAKLVIGCGLQLRFFGEIVRQTMLPLTPFWVVCGAMLCLSAFAAAKGYETRARMGEILVFIVCLPLVLVFAIAASDIDFSNLMPVFVAKPKELVQSSFSAVFAFSGAELCLLVFPYLNKPKRAKKGIVYAMALIGCLMTIVTIITIARFGRKDIQSQIWPVLEMMDTIDLPGSIFERQEALVMSFWIVSIFAIVNATLFFSSLLLRDVVKKGQHVYYIFLLLPVIFFVAYWPKNLANAYEYLEVLNRTFGVAFLFVLPPFMLLVAKIRGLNKNG